MDINEDNKQQENEIKTSELARIERKGYQYKPANTTSKTEPVDQNQFVKACRYGSISEVESLLECGADVNESSLGATPLKNAILGDKPEIVKLLLENGATVTKNELALAKNHKNDEIIKLLESPIELKPINEEKPKEEEKIDPKVFPEWSILYLGDDIALKKWIDAGGNVNMKDDYGNTPLHYTTGHAEDYNPTILTQAQSIPNPKIVKLLLESGAHVNAKNNKGRTPIYNSFGWGVTDLLLENHAEVNIKDNDGDTPLHVTSYLRDPIDVKKILDRKANVNAKNNQGNTPLHLIPLTSFFDTKVDLTSREYEFKKDSTIIKLLLENGADVNIKNNDGKTALDIAKDRNYTELVQLLSKESHRKTLLYLLDEPNKWIDDQIHPVDWELFMQLVQEGADINQKDNYGRSILQRVISAPKPNTMGSENEPEQRAKVIEELIKRGAKLDDATDETGTTPLMEACDNGNLTLTLLLLKHTSNINATDEKGNTALLHAATPHYTKLAGFPPRFRVSYSGHAEIIQALIKAGADINHKNNQGKTALTLAKDTLKQWNSGQGVRDNTVRNIKENETLEKIINILESAGAKE